MELCYILAKFNHHSTQYSGHNKSSGQTRRPSDIRMAIAHGDSYVVFCVSVTSGLTSSGHLSCCLRRGGSVSVTPPSVSPAWEKIF